MAVSGAGFFARGAGSFAAAKWVHQRPARVLPHLVDTALLASGVALAWLLRITPVGAPWLSAKLIGLVVYIGLGVVALRPGRSRRVRAIAWLAALAAYAFIVSAAVTKQALGYFAWL